MVCPQSPSLDIDCFRSRSRGDTSSGTHQARNHPELSSNSDYRTTRVSGRLGVQCFPFCGETGSDGVDLQGPGIGVPSPVMPQSTLQKLILRSAAGGVVASLAMANGGCSSNRPPAAASNQSFAASGVTSAAGIDDRWASVVLDDAQRTEVMDALRGAVFGETAPLCVAEFGVRFEDVPRAIMTAAPTVEMALMKQTFIPAVASVTFLDPGGQEAVASIDLRRMTALSKVEYLIPGDDVAEPASRLLDSINGLLWSNDTFFAGSTTHRRESARAEVEGVQAVRILEAAVKKSGGTPLSSKFEPEKYQIELMMLDDQPARIEVRREPDPKVLSWKAWAGTFPLPEKASALGTAFDEALRAWGRTPLPAKVRDVSTDQE